tara:strand:- start:98 stop:970 length:873 start_codon:yes stop_codon:yes gene_type:complete
VKQRLFVSSTFLPDQSMLIDALDVCSRLSVDGVELGSNHCFEGKYPYLKKFDFAYLVHNFFPIPPESYVVNVASLNEDIRKKSIAHVKASIDFTGDIGAELYTFHPGFLTDPASAGRTETNFDFCFEKLPRTESFEMAENHLYRSLDEIIAYATANDVEIAVETEGSVRHCQQLLMQTPDDFDLFRSRYGPHDIGINLNFGHMYLASKVFLFDVEVQVNSIKEYLVAMELSHNDGVEDSHLPLVRGAWYWPLIMDQDYRHLPKILEFREVSEKQLRENVLLFRQIENEQE